MKAASVGMRRVVVFDPYAQRDRLELERGRDDLFPWKGSLWPLSELLEHPEALNLDPLRLIVWPDVPSEKLGRAFIHFAELCWAVGGLWLIAEEAARYSRDAAAAVLQLSSGGAHGGIRTVFCSQSIGMLTIFARRHLTHVVALNQGDESDFDLLKGLTPGGREFAAKVAAWKPGDRPLLWRQGAGEV